MHSIARRLAFPLGAVLVLGASPGVSLAAITTSPTVTVTPHQVTITWSTDTSRSTEVHWGPSPAANETGYPNHSVYGSPAGTRHSRTLTNVPPGTYYFRVRSTDGVSPDVSAEGSFVVASDGNTPLGTLTPDGTVNALARAGNTLYFGGNFTSLSTRRGQSVAVDPTSGIALTDQPMVASGDVLAIVPDGAGGSYIGGRFQYVGGLSRPYLAHLLPDGGVDPAFAPVLDGEVDALAVSGGTLYVGGTFSHCNGATRSSAAALDAATGTMTGWNPNVQGTLHAVYSLAVSGTTVYLVGSFDQVGGSSRSSAAAVDSTTGSVLPWAPNPDYLVYAVAVSGTTVYFGGNFARINGNVTRNNAAAVDATSGAALPWDPDPSYEVLAIAVSGSRVYLGGSFSTLRGGTVDRRNAAAVDASTGNPLPWDPDPESRVQSLAVSGSTVYLGGSFYSLKNYTTSRHYVAAVNDTSGAPTAWDPNANGPVLAMEASSGRITLGGSLTSVNAEITRNHAAAMDLTTGALTAWNPDLGGSVDAIKLSGSTVYLGGSFYTANGGTLRSYVAAVDASSGTLLPWSPAVSDPVSSIEVSGSTVYLGGKFTQVNGVARLRLAAVDAITGALAPTFVVNLTAQFGSATVTAMAISGNTLYFGGFFDSANGAPRSDAAAVDVTSGALLGWNPSLGSGPAITVNEIVPSGPVVYLGGTFSAMAVDATTGVRTAWQPSVSGRETSIATSGGLVFLGGYFQTVIGLPVPASLVAVDEAAGALTNWRPPLSGSTSAGFGPQAILADCAAGQLVLGGSFVGWGSVPQQGLAIFQGFTCPTADRAPVAAAQSVSTPEDTPRSITLGGSDPDGDPITFLVLSLPSKGDLSGTAPNLTYTPGPDATGADQFTFRVQDSAGASTTATVSITISPVNDPPQADDLDLLTDEDVPVALDLGATDIDGDTLTYSIVQAPAHGSLSGTAPNLTYTPAPDANGTDQFTFTVSDGTAPPVSATATITITPVNDAPVLTVPANSFRVGAAGAFTVSAADVDGDAVTLSASGLPARSAFDAATGAFSWTPDDTQMGDHVVTFSATDGTDATTVNVVLSVSPASACGCGAGPGAAGPAALVMLALALATRRRPRPAPTRCSS